MTKANKAAASNGATHDDKVAVTRDAKPATIGRDDMAKLVGDAAKLAGNVKSASASPAERVLSVLGSYGYRDGRSVRQNALRNVFGGRGTWQATITAGDASTADTRVIALAIAVKRHGLALTKASVDAIVAAVNANAKRAAAADKPARKPRATAQPQPQPQPQPADTANASADIEPQPQPAADVNA
jgi:hypothetical protein